MEPPAFQRGGTGFISLYMLQATFEASQGQIQAESEGKPGCFSAVLPLTKELTHGQGSTAETMEEHSFLASTWAQT